jgi:hypothetical protein
MVPRSPFVFDPGRAYVGAIYGTSCSQPALALVVGAFAQSNAKVYPSHRSVTARTLKIQASGRGVGFAT